MKRLIAAAFATAVSATALVAMAAPSSAHTAVCVGTGTATVAVTGGGLTYPVVAPVPAVQPVRAGTFSLTIGGAGSVGGCASGGGLSLLNATGSLKGWCGHSTGNGTLTDGSTTSAPLSYVSAGSLLVVTLGAEVHAANTTVGTTVTVRAGQGGGVANAVPLPSNVGPPPSGNSCNSTTGATNFQVTGAVLKLS